MQTMIHKAKSILFIFTLALLPVASAHATAAGGKAITIAADLWCPINCDPSSAKSGFGIEIARRIFERQGYTVNYVVIPWARALSEIRAGDVDAVIGANRNDDATLVFPQTPLAHITDDFYVTSDSEITFDNVESLTGKRLGVIHDYGYSNEVETLMAAGRGTSGMVQEVSGDNALEQNVKKLLAGRVDVLIESHLVMEATIRSMALEDRIKRIGGIPQGDVYLAFSQAKPQSSELARIFDDGMKQLSSTGELDALYQTYGVTP